MTPVQKDARQFVLDRIAKKGRPSMRRGFLGEMPLGVVVVVGRIVDCVPGETVKRADEPVTWHIQTAGGFILAFGLPWRILGVI